MPIFILLLAALATAVPAAAQTPATHTLLPVPSSLSLTAARLPLDSTFTVAIARYRDARLERAIDRAVARLEGRLTKALPRRIGSGEAATLVVSVAGRGFAVPDLDEDESYTLSVTAQRATLTAATVVGAMRGLETLLQLQGADGAGFFVQGAEIRDTPRFKWRGLLVDVARHFEPVDVLKRTIDGMAVVKLNVFHWHLSEDQGFRVESRKFPKLQQFGSDGQFYTQEQIRDVVSYAADRGIRVVPEFDMPGHTGSWFVGMPELGSGPGPYAVDRRWGVFAPTLDVTKPATYAFLDAFIGEMGPLFPDRYWHIGGDEVDPNTTEWKTAPQIQAFMKANGMKTTHELQTYFNKKLIPLLAKHGKDVIGWDEILQPDLPTQAVIQSWRGSNYLVDAARQGRRAILSAPYYLDHIKTAGEHYLSDPLPPDNNLTEAQRALVLGGEACMWAEYVTWETIDSRIWPRLGAVAERLWSPASVRDVPDMYRRLEVASRRIAEVGPTHEEHTARMIRRFASDDDAVLFTGLLDYARPRGFGGRGSNQLTPYTRVIDAARPDPWNGWRMLDRARRATAGDSAAVRDLRADFTRMQQFRSGLDASRARVPLSADAVPVADALLQLGRVGEQALGFVTRKSAPSAAWRATADSVLKATDGKTFGLLRPVGVEAVRLLVEATARPLP